MKAQNTYNTDLLAWKGVHEMYIRFLTMKNSFVIHFLYYIDYHDCQHSQYVGLR